MEQGEAGDGFFVGLEAGVGEGRVGRGAAAAGEVVDRVGLFV